MRKFFINSPFVWSLDRGKEDGSSSIIPLVGSERVLDQTFYYNGSTVTQLTDDSYDEFEPRISGNSVVWEIIHDMAQTTYLHRNFKKKSTHYLKVVNLGPPGQSKLEVDTVIVKR